ncbi:hypothetical protein SAMN05421796_108183 [Chryseobacterium piscicola]|uniref:Uncharacterized protein n=1 Tax=Chryseobacterium piscicola TaxID=551459 RepID=A0A1N7NNR9_9FLAO|nr:hypothetical protein [Chryseobacterium piscicola]PQA90396.1 hypothetical protein B0A70_13725 [Chryseobacterium piscicola]SIS99859.1 hypothetical protein SAMN05421796_108183 [Chryseobacterium piscicola]
MKSILILIISVFSQILFAQKSDCSDLKNELKNNKDQITELSKQVDYYKEALNLLKPIRTVDIDGMKLDIVMVNGHKKDKTISVTFIYQNTESTARKSFQCEEAFIIDPQGNQLQTSEVIVAPNKRVRAQNILPEIPTKATMTFAAPDLAEASFLIIKVLTIKIYAKDNKNNPYNAVFENIPVIWE